MGALGTIVVAENAQGWLATALDEAPRLTRKSGGHTGGYLKHFSKVYPAVFRAFRAEVAGELIPADCDRPPIKGGLSGMGFIDAAVRSARLGTSCVRISRD